MDTIIKHKVAPCTCYLCDSKGIMVLVVLDIYADYIKICIEEESTVYYRISRFHHFVVKDYLFLAPVFN